MVSVLIRPKELNVLSKIPSSPFSADDSVPGCHPVASRTDFDGVVWQLVESFFMVMEAFDKKVNG